MAWPTKSNPKTEYVTLRLTPGEAVDLDLWAGGNRSAFVRQAVAEKIEREQRRARKAKTSGKRSEGKTVMGDD